MKSSSAKNRLRSIALNLEQKGRRPKPTEYRVDRSTAPANLVSEIDRLVSACAVGVLIQPLSRRGG